MQHTSWIITEPDGTKKVSVKRKKLAYRPAFKITDKTPDSQLSGAKSFNEMRERLLELGEMESK